MGKPGWTVTDFDTVVFGQLGDCGVVLTLKDGLRAVDDTHQVQVAKSGDGDGDSGGGYVHELNVWRRS